ncbi:MAG TPA: ATP-binding protein, partial [Gemmataceae bacterium]|nr:ATP-binding protein [Gemmataceae bacterium]
AARVQATYSDLSRQVNERSRQLVRSERLVSVGFLAAGVAHEINNPLASIVFCAEALERRFQEWLRDYPQESATTQKYLSMIQSEALRCKEITQKLLEFSRVGERRREPAELLELVQAVLEIAQLLPNCKGKRIVFQPQGRLTALVNAPDIKSVVLNLVVNALDSMDEGGVLTITLRQRGLVAELIFQDTGCGMTPDVLENIFEPFFTRSRTGKGTGLGLFISHQIVTQHEGMIEARSDGPNRGSTFMVRFPLQPLVTGNAPETLTYGSNGLSKAA